MVSNKDNNNKYASELVDFLTVQHLDDGRILKAQ
jgi:hypothetical protein